MLATQDPVSMVTFAGSCLSITVPRFLFLFLNHDSMMPISALIIVCTILCFIAFSYYYISHPLEMYKDIFILVDSCMTAQSKKTHHPVHSTNWLQTTTLLKSLVLWWHIAILHNYHHGFEGSTWMYPVAIPMTGSLARAVFKNARMVSSSSGVLSDSAAQPVMTRGSFLLPLVE